MIVLISFGLCVLAAGFIVSAGILSDEPGFRYRDLYISVLIILGVFCGAAAIANPMRISANKHEHTKAAAQKQCPKGTIVTNIDDYSTDNVWNFKCNGAGDYYVKYK
jgi:hypothetical protein